MKETGQQRAHLAKVARKGLLEQMISEMRFDGSERMRNDRSLENIYQIQVRANEDVLYIIGKGQKGASMDRELRTRRE